MAIKRPKPTKKPVIGEKFWGVRECAFAAVFAVTVEKVGKKYFYSDGCKFRIRDYVHEDSFDHRIILFDDKKSALNWLENIRAWDKFKPRLVDDLPLTHYQLSMVIDWLIAGIDGKKLIKAITESLYLAREDPSVALFLSTEQIEQVRKWSEENEGKGILK